MKPYLGIFRSGGATLLATLLAATANARMEPAPRLTPPPTFVVESTPQLSDSDRSFVTTAAARSMREMAISQAVLEQLSNPQLKSFAEQVIAERTAAVSDLAALAGQKGIDLPSQDEAAVTLDWSKRTDDLDRRYAGEMASQFEGAVKLFGEASSSPDPGISAFAQRTLPALQRQLAAARELQKSLD
jgi:putative membrane protein